MPYWKITLIDGSFIEDRRITHLDEVARGIIAFKQIIPDEVKQKQVRKRFLFWAWMEDEEVIVKEGSQTKWFYLPIRQIRRIERIEE